MTEARPRSGQAADERVLTILAVSEVRGTPEPCGCQSDPLGDVARVVTLLKDAQRRGGALLVDAGGLRYGNEPLPPARQPQAEAKADFLEKAWHDVGALVALGDEDMPNGPERVAVARRLASNVNGAAVRAPEVVEVGGVRVGVFGVVDPDKARIGLVVSDPIDAARGVAGGLKARGAQVVVALAHMKKGEARKLARAVSDIDIVVAGDEVGAEAEQVGNAILVQPADEAQKVARVELHVVGGVVSTRLFADADERTHQAERLGKRVEQIDLDLARFTADPDADPLFIKSRRDERLRLTAERDQLRAAPAAPPTGSYAVAALIPVRRKIARDEGLAAGMKALDARIGEGNRAAAEKVPAPPAAHGEARYLGIDECETCHPAAVKFWKTTVHAKAWQELVAVNKQWSYDCISCHVTGYGKAGGSAMAHVDKLSDVQCEVCHGPGSLHADKPKRAQLKIPLEADCKECHQPEHSDTFQFLPYLRDILGEGHGEKKRALLGDGPTGHALRHGAIERARATP